MREKRRQYDRDYKVSAVKLLESSDKPLDLVARGLGISGSMLRRWRDQILMNRVVRIVRRYCDYVGRLKI
jgi:transposase-like protein